MTTLFVAFFSSIAGGLIAVALTRRGPKGPAGEPGEPGEPGKDAVVMVTPPDVQAEMFRQMRESMGRMQ